MSDYGQFLDSKRHLGGQHGFEPVWMPDFLYDFQASLVDWATRRGRAAIFADCGLGKTPMQLVWAQNVVQKTGGAVLIATPLAVSYQVLAEAEKFGIEAHRVVDGTWGRPGIAVTNYERLDRFRPSDFVGMVCDESSILKNFDGVRRKAVTEFMKKLPYRLLCTATAAPNDYIELGTSAEALGELGHSDMLARFFKNDQNVSNTRVAWRGQGGVEKMKWRFRGHAEIPFWRWVSSWARAVRRPSDLGFEDGRFVLQPLQEREEVVAARSVRDGMLFSLPAVGLREEREERRRTVQERCERIGELVAGDDHALVWCHLNSEGDLLADLIDGSEQVAGSDSDDRKEGILSAFAAGNLRVLVTKPKIGAWGLNLQRCAHVTFFPSHSYEQYYQGVRRCWRFGQERPVVVDVVATEGEAGIKDNLQRKSEQADKMFSSLVAHMNEAISITTNGFYAKEEVPSWLSKTRS
jgi:hypothetical protein